MQSLDDLKSPVLRVWAQVYGGWRRSAAQSARLTSDGRLDLEFGPGTFSLISRVNLAVNGTWQLRRSLAVCLYLRGISRGRTATWHYARRGSKWGRLCGRETPADVGRRHRAGAHGHTGPVRARQDSALQAVGAMEARAPKRARVRQRAAAAADSTDSLDAAVRRLEREPYAAW